MVKHILLLCVFLSTSTVRNMVERDSS